MQAFEGAVNLNVVTRVPDGFIEATIFRDTFEGESESLDVTTTFESDGSGGWRARFTGEGFDFTVP